MMLLYFTLTFDLDGDLCPGRLAHSVGGRADVDAGVVAAHPAELQREALLPLPPGRYQTGLQYALRCQVCLQNFILLH